MVEQLGINFLNYKQQNIQIMQRLSLFINEWKSTQPAQSASGTAIVTSALAVSPKAVREKDSFPHNRIFTKSL